MADASIDEKSPELTMITVNTDAGSFDVWTDALSATLGNGTSISINDWIV